MTAREIDGARAAYTYWASRGGMLTESAMRDVTPWEKLPAHTRETWVGFVAHIIAALNAEGFEIARLEQVGWWNEKRGAHPTDFATQHPYECYQTDAPLFRKLPEDEETK